MRYLGCRLTVCSIARDGESVVQWEPYTSPYTGGRQWGHYGTYATSLESRVLLTPVPSILRCIVDFLFNPFLTSWFLVLTQESMLIVYL